jgi:Flp pilus assembly protein TadG
MFRPFRGPRAHRPAARGQALVEFAIVFPVFLLVLSAVFDFGALLYTRMTVINATREGARAAVQVDDPTTIPSVVQGRIAASAGGLSTSSPTMTISASCVAIATSGSCSWSSKTSSQAGDAVSVAVTYQYHMFFPLLFGTTIPITSNVQMVLE